MKGVVDITLHYGNRRVVVTLKPNVAQAKLECLQVTEQNTEVVGEERYQFIVAAEREFMAVLASWLQPRPTHYQATCMAERIELSFAYTLNTLDHEVRLRISPLGFEDLRVLQMLARDLSAAIADCHQQARKEKRAIPTGYLDDLKAHVLQEWQSQTPCSPALRDFYSSVLGRAFAYKQGKVPYQHYIEAKKYLPGIKLAFSQT